MQNELISCLKIALKHHVTDIHFNLDSDEKLTIEMRVNGTIKKIKNSTLDAQFFRYLLFKANLDVSHTFIPQTGQFEMEVDNLRLSLRVALLSSLHRSSAVLRILNNHSTLTIDDLCSNLSQIEWMKTITSYRNGLYVFSGPTGSGKTTTLYTILNAEPVKKIFTLEDPIEVYSERFVQLQVNEKQHLSYQEGIKQLMRHDPDIIMIGEIRDAIAAEMAIRSALTGHLVLTSLHSYSCVGAIERLLDLGVSKWQLQDVLHGVSNQRLYTSHEGKIGIYEIMNRKELTYYFQNQKQHPSFRTLNQEIKHAISEGIIQQKEAQQDLID